MNDGIVDPSEPINLILISIITVHNILSDLANDILVDEVLDHEDLIYVVIIEIVLQVRRGAEVLPCVGLVLKARKSKKSLNEVPLNNPIRFVFSLVVEVSLIF